MIKLIEDKYKLMKYLGLSIEYINDMPFWQFETYIEYLEK